MFLKSAFDTPIHIISKLMVFVYLCDLHVRVHPGVVDNLSLQGLLGTSVIDRIALHIFPVKRQIGPRLSRPIALIWEYTVLSDLLAVIYTDLNIESNMPEPADNHEKTPLFQKAKRLPPPPNLEICIPAPTSSARTMSAAPHPSSMFN